MKISMILCKVRDSDIAALPPMNIQNQLHASKQTHTVGSEINTKYKCQNHVGDIIATGFFHLQMRISFPFLRAKDLCTSLLIMRTHSYSNFLQNETSMRQRRDSVTVSGAIARKINTPLSLPIHLSRR